MYCTIVLDCGILYSCVGLWYTVCMFWIVVYCIVVLDCGILYSCAVLSYNI